MAWTSSNRKAELPADWARRRALCIDNANGRCQAHTEDGYGWEWPTPLCIGPDYRCIKTATDADHWVSRDDHRIKSLRALCSDHHRQKTNRESAAARAAARRKLRIAPEKSPGLL